MNDGLLEIRDVAISFGGLDVLKDVSAIISGGTITGLIGPNGAGKTTLINAVSGHVHPQQGTITFGGVDLGALRPRARPGLGIARTFQHSQLFDGLTVLDQFMCGAYSARTGGGLAEILRLPSALRRDRELRQTSLELIERLGIGRYATVQATALPGALKQLVDLGRALMSDPQLLLLDEIAAGTTIDERELIVGIVREYQEQTGMAVLVIEHDLEFIRELASTVIVLANGGLLAAGPTEDVLARADVLEAYVGASDD